LKIVDDLKRKELTERIQDITRGQMALQGQIVPSQLLSKVERRTSGKRGLRVGYQALARPGPCGGRRGGRAADG